MATSVDSRVMTRHPPWPYPWAPACPFLSPWLHSCMAGHALATHLHLLPAPRVPPSGDQPPRPIRHPPAAPLRCAAAKESESCIHHSLGVSRASQDHCTCLAKVCRACQPPHTRLLTRGSCAPPTRLSCCTAFPGLLVCASPSGSARWVHPVSHATGALPLGASGPADRFPGLCLGRSQRPGPGRVQRRAP
ncbi:MAG: hypothetical protein J3K34DRAFT_253107 [Monoraphidium minutum]|nr:MAG: hypothetical protein J3K34DRAFT_253107 [Monoraphidium minutum]